MATDVDAMLFLGAIIDLAEIFVSTEAVPYKCKECPKSHAAKLKFCGECGQRFKLEKQDKWAPHVMAYFREQELSIEEDDTNLGEFYAEGPFYNVTGYQGYSDSDDSAWAVGVQLVELSMGEDITGALPVTFCELETAKQEVKDLFVALGLKPRELSLFPVLRVSS